MKNALLALAIIALGWNAYAMDALRQTTATPPAWVTGGPSAICDDASPCAMPVETFEAFQISIDWYESDGVTPCPEPASRDIHPQTPCGPDPQIRHWLALSRGGPAWLPSATDHDVFVAQGPIYSGGPNATGIAEYNGQGLSGRYAYGEVVTFMLPASAVQAPQLPVLDAVAWQAWFDAACAQNATCSTGGGALDQTTFDAFLATSPYSSHNHGFAFTLTRPESLDGVTHNGVTSVPQ